MKLNENLKERRWGFAIMGFYIALFLFYLVWDGWLYEWVEYGYAGASQHFDFNIFGDMQWEIVDGKQVYYSTNNLHNLVYMCYWTGTISYLALITGNKWLRQGSIATWAFPVISFFSTINPMVAKDVFTLDIFYYHSYILQIMYDINHLLGLIMGTYQFYQLSKRDEKMEYKYLTPTIMMTWVLFMLARLFLQKSWVPGEELGMISTNQINDMPFYFYGLEYIIVIAILFLINFLIKTFAPKISNPKLRTLVPFVVFASITIILVGVGLIKLQEISPTAFIQP